MQDFESLRKSKKVTQVELSKELEITQQAISRWENGKAKPSLDTMRKIADFFKCDLMEVINCF